MTYTPTTGPSAASSWRAPGGPRMTKGRWVALAIGVPVALALIGWTGFSLVGLFARGSYQFAYPVPVHDGQVSVTVNSGNVTLRQVQGPGAEMTGTVQYGLIRPGITESTSAGHFTVSVSCDGVAGNCGMTGTLDVPARTGVTLSSNGGDISASGFTSPVTLSTGGGNMNASNLAGNLRLDTGGGDVTGSGLSGDVQISTGGGNVNASNLVGTVRLDTGGGDVSGNGFSGPVEILTDGGNVNGNGVASQQVNVQSGGGDVTLVFTAVPTNLQITADGGNITVVLPPGSTKYDILTPGTSGGNVSIPPSLENSQSPDTISLNSGGGDITVTQS